MKVQQGIQDEGSKTERKRQKEKKREERRVGEI
jgi:hypothetical protein